jgi:glycine cleavage system aminomethyltransferase T
VASLAAYDPLRPPSAVTTERDGVPVVAHYGSVSAELAASTKAAGLVDRSGIRQLAIRGQEALVDRVLAALVPGGGPGPGRAVSVGGTWCCRVTGDKAVVAGGPTSVGRWRQVAARAIATAGLDVELGQPAGAAALSLIGPRAARIAAAAGLGAELDVGEVAAGAVAGSPVVLARETADHFLLLFEAGHPNEVWQALWDAGHALGLAPVGNEALELLQASHRPFG